MTARLPSPPARTAHNSRGGALPGIVGNDLVRDVCEAIGCLPGVTVMRNPVMRVRLPSGGYAWTGIGGEGAPDLHVEVMTPSGVHACAWFECKSGTGELNQKQRQWHAAAEKMGRHVYVIREVRDAVAVVEAFRMGSVVRP
jgi:hypothetical protein